MTRCRVLLVACVSAGILACKGADKNTSTPITGKILLRYHPPQGAVYRYTIEQSSRFGPDSATADSLGRTTLLLAFSQSIGARDADGVSVTTTLDSARIASPMLNPAAAADVASRLRGLHLTAVLDDHQRVLRGDFSALNQLPPMVSDQVQLGFHAANLPLADQPVGSGDSWTNEMVLPIGQLAGGAPLKTSTKLTVREITVVRGDTTVRLSAETGLPDRPMQFTMGGQPVTVALRGAVTGEQVFSLTRGAIVGASFGSGLRVTITGGFFGPQGMAMRIDQQGTMTLVDSAR